MNLKQMKRYVLDKLNTEEGDRRIESLITSALNDAYLEVAMADCTVEEEMYFEPLLKTLDLPDDFLVAVQLQHSIRGKIDEEQYQIRGLNLLITADVAHDGDLTLVYGTRPDPLEKDTDVPRIRLEYHRCLCYFALYEISEEDKYMQLYVDVLNSIPPFEPFSDDGIASGEFVIDIHSR